jgi:uncharacterized membrane protein
MWLYAIIALFYCKKGKQTYLRFLLFALLMSTHVNGRNKYAFPTIAVISVVVLAASTANNATTRTVFRQALIYL